MTVSTKAFQHWLRQAGGDIGTAELARLTGIKKSTLAQQLVRGRVAVGTVVAASRAIGVDPRRALSGFDQFGDLALVPPMPTEAEVLSQVADSDLLQEIINRRAAAEGHVARPNFPLSPTPHPSSVRCWLDAVGPADLRQRLARDSGVAPQNLSTQVSANRLTPELALQAARIAGVGLANGLAATGLFTLEEAGWPALAREAALGSVANSTLVETAVERLEMLGKTLRRVEQDIETQQAVWENLA
ncbi:hypothetical protein [Specibacter cremeus]|uniref:hypothetical protein n=1 Tax=Specibacter cremeus TaxID=1629051 RepID=UPI000F7A9C4B|nr:hypothetical protein [Specibacter cremeus]